MTKKEIVNSIVEKTGAKAIDVKKTVQMVFDEIVNALVESKTIELRNFGVFKIKERKPRTGRNPRTGQEVPIPTRKVVVFKPGLLMKQRVK